MSEKDRHKWTVALSCCFINCMLYGVSRLSGMLLIPLVETYHVSRAAAALPFSISSCLRNLIGPFAGHLSQYFGIRKIVILGCILAFFGSSLCCYAETMLETTVFWGAIFGTGLGISTTLMPLAINQNFSKFQSTASGISYSGAFMGSFIFPPLLSFSICEYGLSGSFLIISAVMLNSLVAAMFLRTAVKCNGKNVLKKTGKKDKKSSGCAELKIEGESLRIRPSIIGKPFEESKNGVHRSITENGNNNIRSVSSSDIRYSESSRNVNQRKFSDLFKIFRSQEVNSLNSITHKENVSHDTSNTSRPYIEICPNLDRKCDANYLVKNGVSTQNLSANYFVKNCIQADDIRNDDNITIGRAVSSSNGILQAKHEKATIVPVCTLNLTEDSRQVENTNNSHVSRDTFYQKCRQYMKLFKRLLNFNVASYSLTKKRENAPYDIHGNYLEYAEKPFFTRLNPLRTSATYLNNISMYNFNVPTENDVIELNSFQSMSNDLTCLPFRKHHRGSDAEILGNTKQSRKSTDEQACKDNRKASGHKLLSKTSINDYAEPLSHPQIKAMDSFPAYHKLSKREFSFNVLDSTTAETPKVFEGCFLEWLKMFSDPVFIFISGTKSFFSFVTICILTIIEDFAKDYGVDQSDVHFVLMTMSAADLLGTLTLGWITDKGYITRSRFTATCFFGIGITVACIPFTHGFCEILVVVAIYGILESGVIIMFPLLTAEYINPKRHAIAIASTNLLSSPAMLLVPLAIGFFRDNLGHYDGLFYLLSLISMLCCGAWLFVPQLLHRRHQTL